jgi:hypothetical protein
MVEKKELENNTEGLLQRKQVLGQALGLIVN